MESYSRDEMVSATELARHSAETLDKVKKNSRVALMRNNKIEAVIISVDEYEKMREILEYREISEIVRTRAATPRKRMKQFRKIIK